MIQTLTQIFHVNCFCRDGMLRGLEFDREYNKYGSRAPESIPLRARAVDPRFHFFSVKCNISIFQYSISFHFTNKHFCRFVTMRFCYWYPRSWFYLVLGHFTRLTPSECYVTESDSSQMLAKPNSIGEISAHFETTSTSTFWRAPFSQPSSLVILSPFFCACIGRVRMKFSVPPVLWRQHAITIAMHAARMPVSDASICVCGIAPFSLWEHSDGKLRAELCISAYEFVGFDRNEDMSNGAAFCAAISSLN